MNYFALHRGNFKSNKFVTLVADLLFVNGEPFLITVLCGMHFVTVKHVPTRTSKQLSKSLKKGYENIFQN